MKEIRITKAEREKEFQLVRQLFLEYAQSYNFDICFDDFDKELESLPGEYSAPGGSLLLAYVDNEVAGCVALKKVEEKLCEMKRLYVRPQYRGEELGRMLAISIMQEAKKIGYETMCLNTTSTMKEAISLYRSIGFAETGFHHHKQVKNVIYMEKKIH
jgi:N-acetylglutamate synthase-like GNAT family acetyltransferase